MSDICGITVITINLMNGVKLLFFSLSLWCEFGEYIIHTMKQNRDQTVTMSNKLKKNCYHCYKYKC